MFIQAGKPVPLQQVDDPKIVSYGNLAGPWPQPGGK